MYRKALWRIMVVVFAGTLLFGELVFSLSPRIVAEEEPDKSADIIEVDKDSLDTSTIPQVSDLTVSTADFNTLTLSFTVIVGIDKYEIQRSTKKNKGFKMLATVDTGSYLSGGLKTGKTYYYRVRAVDAEGKRGPFSVVRAAKPVPGKAEIMGVTETSPSQLTVTVAPVAGATGYQYSYQTSPTGAWSKAGNSPTAVIVVNNLPGATSYYFRVRAFRKVGKKTFFGSYSDVSTAATVTRVVPGDNTCSITRVGVGGTGIKFYKRDAYWTGKIRFYEYTIRNNGTGELVITNKNLAFMSVGDYYDITTRDLYLADGKGKRRSEIRIAPGKSAKVRFYLNKTRKNAMAIDAFTVQTTYDGLAYEITAICPGFCVVVDFYFEFRVYDDE